MKKNTGAVLTVCIGAVLVAVLIAWTSHTGLSPHALFNASSLTALQHHIRSMGPWGPIVTIGVMTLHCVTFIPSEIPMIANLLLFGPVFGTVYTWIGGMLGAALAFFLARTFGRPLVLRFVPAGLLQRFDTWFAKRGVWGLLLLRFIPFLSFNAVNYGAGLTNVSWWNFVWTTAVGILPFEIAFAVMYQTVSTHTLSWVIFALFGISAIAVLGIILLRRRRRR